MPIDSLVYLTIHRLPLNAPGDQPHNDPPPKVLTEIEQIIANHSSLFTTAAFPNGDNNKAFRRNIQPPASLCGRVINAIIWEENLWSLIQNECIIDVGSFVRLRNINNAKLPTGTNCE